MPRPGASAWFLGLEGSAVRLLDRFSGSERSGPERGVPGRLPPGARYAV